MPISEKRERRKPCEHLSNGREFWRVGKIGFFIRLRGIALATAVPLLTMGVPWWWDNKYAFNPQFSLTFLQASTALLFILAIILLLALNYLRKRTIRSLDVKRNIHNFAHDVRNHQSTLYEITRTGKKFGDKRLERQTKQLLNSICENTAKHFQLLEGVTNIDSAIRLATEDEQGNVVYSTYARSTIGGLSPGRALSSEAIPRSGPTPRILADDNQRAGILVYNDVDYALECGVLSPTKNFESFKGEISSMIVAPMNAWVGDGGPDMIGLLYVSSKRKDVFSGKHVDPLLFFADVAANAVSCLFNFVQLNEDRGNAP